MKKGIVALTLGIMTALTLCAGCANNAGNKADTGSTGGSLVERGIQMTKEMGELAASTEFRELMSASEDLKKVQIEMGNEDYAEPRSIYKVSVNSADMIKAILPETHDSISDVVRSRLTDQCLIALTNQAAAKAGTAVLAAASTVASNECFMDASLLTPTAFLYIYDGGYSSIVSYRPGSDGAVYANSMFIKNDVAIDSINTEADMETWISTIINMKGVNVETVELP